MKLIIKKHFIKYKKIYSYEKNNVRNMREVIQILIIVVVVIIIEDQFLEWKKFMIE